MPQLASPPNVSSSKWIDTFARLGYATKGIIYSLIGLLALLAAFQAGGQTTDSQGVLTTLAGQPFGKFMLFLIGIGFACYALWRLIEVVKDPEHPNSSGAESVFHRLSYLVKVGIYGGLAFTAFKLAMGSGGESGSSSQDSVARIMALPLGRWLIALGGAIVLGGAFYEMYRGFKAKFRGKLKLQEMSADERTWATRVGRLGLIARSIVFSLIGIFALQAAYYTNPSRIQDPGEALQTLQQWANPWVFAVMALGLLAYGIHMFFMARYGRIATGQ
ncbi:DUF1206 domain-containing protein [Pseudanabaena sp. FACHB-2040]|uniref:DUF1206 domain-containing protein n=1 Tax=Pseudanabaena sp. FACHB-2040 TaxID=2692859 RepID=UPI001685FFA2|nr:DUF1206 domain-containing protein [Pseudanabaena sp. FACHB-2040]MBD2260250.1 DUF1206 domain-containing protein [Pseudanabaena sp. FACHB-2040]